MITDSPVGGVASIAALIFGNMAIIRGVQLSDGCGEWRLQPPTSKRKKGELYLFSLVAKPRLSCAWWSSGFRKGNGMNRTAQLVHHLLGGHTEAELVRSLRADWSQTRLAVASGVTRNVIANVETGRQRLMVEQLAALARGRLGADG